MKKRGRNSQSLTFGKRAQLKISFGMIFSIMLVIAFLAFGFFAIQKFLGIQENIVMKKFVDDFQEDVNKMWKSTQGSKKVEYSVGKDVTSVCFEYSPYYNTLIYEGDKYVEQTFDKVDIEKTLGSKDSVCSKTKDGKIIFYLEKKYGSEDVTIKV